MKIMNDEEIMEKIRDLSLERFNVQNMRSSCNVKGCPNKPEKEIFIYEYTMKMRKGLVTIYLCRDHLPVVREFMHSIREIAPKVVIEKRVLPIK